jgi:Restriction endonuclease
MTTPHLNQTRSRSTSESLEWMGFNALLYNGPSVERYGVEVPVRKHTPVSRVKLLESFVADQPLSINDVLRARFAEEHQVGASDRNEDGPDSAFVPSECFLEAARRSTDPDGNAAIVKVAAGLLTPEGQPFRSGDPRAQSLLRHARNVNDQILSDLADKPGLLHQLTPRRFEEVVAELLVRQGYEVELTPYSRDGGRDLLAARRDELGSFLFFVECKKYASARPVGVEIVRQLYGVVAQAKATAGLVVTTSHFTKGAEDFRSQIRHQMDLKDFTALVRWLNRYRKVN